MKNHSFSFVVFLSILSAYPLFSQTVWTQTNGPNEGWVRYIAFKGDEAFLGTGTGGLFRSSDAGLHWKSTQLDTVPGNLVFVAPNGNILVSGGVSRVSSDNGVTWHEPQFVNTWGNVYSLWCLAANSSGTIFAGTEYGVLKSTDGGFTYDTTAGLPKGVQSICVNAIGDVFIALDLGLVYWSTNNGNTWQERSNGITDSPIRGLTCSKKNGDIYAASHYGKIFRSSNNGANWSLVCSTSSGFDGEVLTVDTTGTVYAGSIGYVLRSTDNGVTWDTTVNGFRGKYVRSMNTSPRGWVYAATETGVYMTSDKGASWHQRNNGLTITYVNALAKTSSGYVFAATEHAGTFRTTDGGANWTKMPGTDATNYCVMVAPNGFVYVGTYTDWWHQGGIFRSTDNGGSWQRFEAENQTITSFGYNSLGHLFAGGAGVLYRSIDNGITWQRHNENIGGYPQCIVQHSSGVMYLASDYTVYKSTDNGNIWTQTSFSTFENPVLRRLVFLPDGSIVVGGKGLWRSTDQGGVWTKIEVPDMFVMGLLATPAGELFIGTQYMGVFKSSGNFDSWTPWHSGIRTGQVNELMLDNEGYIWAATDGRSVYKTSNPITGVDETERLPQEFALYQNYPNPFNPVTKMKYVIDVSGGHVSNGNQAVTLKVYDMLGSEIATLVDENQAPGEYEVTFDGSKFSSGIYFCVLRQNDASITRKLVLLK